MNSFLLAFTAVLILVLSALFAAPLFIDWNDYRPVFETQASKLLGRDVKVGGKVHLVVLPAPELRFDDVKVADEKGSFEQPLLEVRSIEAWLNIGSLLRGAIETRKIAIAEPVLRIVVKEDGTGNWSDVGRAGEALPFAPKEVLLDEISVSGGRIEVTRPGAPAIVFEDVYGAGSAASLSGPYKVSANYIFAGRPQELRFSTSASDPDGVFRLKTALRDPDRNTTYLLEGDVTGFKEKPSFDGAIIMRIASALPPEGTQESERQADATQDNGALPSGEQGAGADAHLSAFELKGKLTATPERAELPVLEIAVHSKGRSQMMKGKLALDFGAQPKAEGELAASWVDVDALLTAGAPANTPVDISAAGVLSAIAERALKEAATVGDGTLTIDLDQASIGGDLVGGIDLVVAAKDGAVTVERLQADLPGSNRIEASGRLAEGERGPVFEGPVTLDGSKLKTLVRWAAGARDMSGQATVGAFTFSAKTVIGGGDLKLEDASGELSGTKFSGALHYRGGEHRVVDLNLDSDRLDLREVLGESAAWQSWLPDPAAAQGTAPASDQSLLGALRDDEVHATLRVGELLLPNIPPGRLDARFSLAKDNLDVERLDFAAPGAIALNGNGSIARLSTAPAGQADLSIQAMTADGLKVTTELLGLGEGVTKSKQLPSLAPLDLHVGLTATRDGAATSASIEVKGKAGGSDVAIIAKAAGDPANLADASIDIDGSVKGERPQALLGLLMPGLASERLAVAGAERGKFTLRAQGVPSRSVTGRAELATDAMQLAFDGEGSLKPEGMALAGVASAKGRNAGMALALFGLGASPSASAVPLDLSAEVAKTASVIDLTSISGEVDGVPITGSAHFDLGGEQPRFNLAAKADFASLPALLGSLVAWQRTPSTETLLGSLNQSASDVWPARGFALEAIGSADGEIRIEANTLALGAPFKVEDATLIANVSEQGLAVIDLQGRLFGGSFSASGTLVPKGTGAELKAHAELATGRMDQLSRAIAGRVLAKGPFTFVMDVSGEGLSPPGLVAGLSGDGALFLDPGALQALSPEPLKRVAVEANRSEKLKLDKDQITARMTTLQDTLTKGTYAYSATVLPFGIKNGTLKLDPAALAGKGAETTINGYVELASLRLDSEWAMRLKDSRDADMPPVNLVFAGSLGDAGAIAPQIDTAPMEGFLTVRRMEGDVERLETLDVSGRGQPEAEAEVVGAEADVSDDSNPVAQVTAEALAAKKEAVEKRAADRAAEVKRIAAEKVAAEKRAAEQAAAKKRAAEKAAADKLAAEKEAAERVAAERRAAEKAAAEKAAAEKRAAEKAAAEQRAAEKLAAEKAAAEKRAAEKAAAEEAWAEKRAAEKAAAEKRAAEKAAAAKAAAEKAAAAKAAAEQRAAEKHAAEKAAAEQRAAEKAAAEKAAAEKRAAEKAADEKAAAEKRAAVKAAAERRGAEKAAAEKAAAEKLTAEKAAAENLAAEKAAAEKAEAEKAAAAQAPRAADLEANTATPGAVPSRQGEQLPWSQDQASPAQASPTDAPASGPQPAAAAQEEIAAPVAPVTPVQRRQPKPPPAPDDWKKGISIFGGG